MDVEIDHGMFYGAARVWTDATRPHLGEQQVHLVTAIDTDLFVHDFVRAAQAAAPSRP